MFKIIVFSLALILASCSQNSLKKQNVPPLKNLQHFDVIPLIVSSSLDEKAVAKGMLDALGKIGTVDTSQTYSDEQHIKSSLFSFWIGNIAEEGVDKNAPAKYLPVIWISLQISEGVEILKNQSRLPCKIWRKDYYVEQSETQNETTAKTNQIVKMLIDEFRQDYQSANPSGEKPVFFVKNSL